MSLSGQVDRCGALLKIPCASAGLRLAGSRAVSLPELSWDALRSRAGSTLSGQSSTICDVIRDSPGRQYAALLPAVAAALERLPARQRLDQLFAMISPLLDEFADWTDEFQDEPVLTTAEAVEGFRRIAAGADLDADAVHHHLTDFAWAQSEDQDPEMHVRSQAAWLAADWLSRSIGRKLRTVDGIGDSRFDSMTDIVNELAWTRSRQTSLHPDDAADDEYDQYFDKSAALLQLRAMAQELGA